MGGGGDRAGERAPEEWGAGEGQPSGDMGTLTGMHNYAERGGQWSGLHRVPSCVGEWGLCEASAGWQSRTDLGAMWEQ